MIEVVLALGVGGLVTTSEGQLVNCKLDKVVHCEGEQIYFNINLSTVKVNLLTSQG